MEMERQKAIENDENLRRLDIEFRERLREEQKQWDIKHEDMKQNLKAWKLDNDNYNAYVEEFYEKSWEIYK